MHVIYITIDKINMNSLVSGIFPDVVENVVPRGFF
jgi:hypothetical protein